MKKKVQIKLSKIISSVLPVMMLLSTNGGFLVWGMSGGNLGFTGVPKAQAKVARAITVEEIQKEAQQQKSHWWDFLWFRKSNNKNKNLFQNATTQLVKQGEGFITQNGEQVFGAGETSWVTGEEDVLFTVSDLDTIMTSGDQREDLFGFGDGGNNVKSQNLNSQNSTSQVGEDGSTQTQQDTTNKQDFSWVKPWTWFNKKNDAKTTAEIDALDSFYTVGDANGSEEDQVTEQNNGLNYDELTAKYGQEDMIGSNNDLDQVFAGVDWEEAGEGSIVKDSEGNPILGASNNNGFWRGLAQQVGLLKNPVVEQILPSDMGNIVKVINMGKKLSERFNDDNKNQIKQKNPSKIVKAPTIMDAAEEIFGKNIIVKKQGRVFIVYNEKDKPIGSVRSNPDNKIYATKNNLNQYVVTVFNRKKETSPVAGIGGSDTQIVEIYKVNTERGEYVIGKNKEGRIIFQESTKEAPSAVKIGAKVIGKFMNIKNGGPLGFATELLTGGLDSLKYDVTNYIDEQGKPINSKVFNYTNKDKREYQKARELFKKLAQKGTGSVVSVQMLESDGAKKSQAEVIKYVKEHLKSGEKIVDVGGSLTGTKVVFDEKGRFKYAIRPDGTITYREKEYNSLDILNDSEVQQAAGTIFAGFVGSLSAPVVGLIAGGGAVYNSLSPKDQRLVRQLAQQAGVNTQEFLQQASKYLNSEQFKQDCENGLCVLKTVAEKTLTNMSDAIEEAGSILLKQLPSGQYEGYVSLGDGKYFTKDIRDQNGTVLNDIYMVDKKSGRMIEIDPNNPPLSQGMTREMIQKKLKEAEVIKAAKEDAMDTFLKGDGPSPYFINLEDGNKNRELYERVYNREVEKNNKIAQELGTLMSEEGDVGEELFGFKISEISHNNENIKNKSVPVLKPTGNEKRKPKAINNNNATPKTPLITSSATKTKGPNIYLNPNKEYSYNPKTGQYKECGSLGSFFSFFTGCQSPDNYAHNSGVVISEQQQKDATTTKNKSVPVLKPTGNEKRKPKAINNNNATPKTPLITSSATKTKGPNIYLNPNKEYSYNPKTGQYKECGSLGSFFSFFTGCQSPDNYAHNSGVVISEQQQKDATTTKNKPVSVLKPDGNEEKYSQTSKYSPVVEFLDNSGVLFGATKGGQEILDLMNKSIVSGESFDTDNAIRVMASNIIEQATISLAQDAFVGDDGKLNWFESGITEATAGIVSGLAVNDTDRLVETAAGIMINAGWDKLIANLSESNDLFAKNGLGSSFGESLIAGTQEVVTSGDWEKAVRVIAAGVSKDYIQNTLSNQVDNYVINNMGTTIGTTVGSAATTGLLSGTSQLILDGKIDTGQLAADIGGAAAEKAIAQAVGQETFTNISPAVGLVISVGKGLIMNGKVEGNTVAVGAVSTVSGLAAGATMGSVVPGIGTVVGAVAGVLLGSVFSDKPKDYEIADWKSITQEAVNPSLFVNGLDNQSMVNIAMVAAQGNINQAKQMMQEALKKSSMGKLSTITGFGKFFDSALALMNNRITRINNDFALGELEANTEDYINTGDRALDSLTNDYIHLKNKLKDCYIRNDQNCVADVTKEIRDTRNILSGTVTTKFNNEIAKINEEIKELENEISKAQGDLRAEKIRLEELRRYRDALRRARNQYNETAHSCPSGTSWDINKKACLPGGKSVSTGIYECERQAGNWKWENGHCVEMSIKEARKRECLNRNRSNSCLRYEWNGIYCEEVESACGD